MVEGLEPVSVQFVFTEVEDSQCFEEDMLAAVKT